jgi:DNA replication protein DnaC
METKTESLHAMARQLRLTGLGGQINDLLNLAQQEQNSYLDFALKLLETEINYRNRRNLEKRLKTAKMPRDHDLANWNDSSQSGVTRHQLIQLKECLWLEQNFNLILMGPSGTGKTYIAAGLCNEALKIGYRAAFRTMDQINNLLKMKDITKSAAREYELLLKSDLLVIDDIMMFPIEKKQAVSLFNLIDYLHHDASIIVTTNKSPDEWVKVLDDEVLATAILDRILFKCEVIKLTGKSFRLENRKTIFENVL